MSRQPCNHEGLRSYRGLQYNSEKSGDRDRTDSPLEEIVRDTSNVARDIQVRIQRQLTGPERLLLAMDMSAAARELLLTRLRHQHPDWTDRLLKQELLRCAFYPAPVPVSLR